MIVVPSSASSSLERVDLVVALRPDLLRDEVVDPDDEDVLVVRPVEDRDLALAGRRAGGPATGSRGRARSGVGTLNDVTVQPCGLNALITCRIVPSLPAASMPWRTIEDRVLRLGPEPLLEVGQARSRPVRQLGSDRGLVVAVRRPGSKSARSTLRARLDPERVAERWRGDGLAIGRCPAWWLASLVGCSRDPICAGRPLDQESRHDHDHRRQAASDLPRRPLGRIADPLVIANPADPANPAGSTFHATEAQYEEAVEAAVAAFEVTRHAARLRARRDPARTSAPASRPAARSSAGSSPSRPASRSGTRWSRSTGRS